MLLLPFVIPNYRIFKIVNSDESSKQSNTFLSAVKDGNNFAGLTGNISVGEWQIALLVHFRRAMECSCKSALKICQLEIYLTSFTNAKLFPSFTGERKVFDCSKHFSILNKL